MTADKGSNQGTDQCLHGREWARYDAMLKIMTNLAHSVSMVGTAMDRDVVATGWWQSAAEAIGRARVSLDGLGAWRGLVPAVRRGDAWRASRAA